MYNRVVQDSVHYKSSIKHLKTFLSILQNMNYFRLRMDDRFASMHGMEHMKTTYPSTTRSSKWIPYFRFRHQNPDYIKKEKTRE